MRTKEEGVMIVEATFVFPIMFFVIFLMIYLGNVYLQRSKVETYAIESAVEGAAMCADPMLLTAEEGGVNKDMLKFSMSNNIQPYRYIFGNMKEIEGNIEALLTKKLNGMETGLFRHMELVPGSVKVSTDYNSVFIYSTFRVNVHYKIKMPIRFIGEREAYTFDMTSVYEMPVDDVDELIRNVNMVVDYLDATGVSGKIQELTGKVKEFFHLTN